MRHCTLSLISSNCYFINDLFWRFLWRFLFITTWRWTWTCFSTLIIFECFVINNVIKDISVCWDHNTEWKTAFLGQVLTDYFFEDFNITFSIDKIRSVLVFVAYFDILIFMFLKFFWDFSGFFNYVFIRKNLEIRHCCLEFSYCFGLKSCFSNIEFVTFIFILFY